MYKRIMVAIDNSETAEKALLEAVEIAQLHHSALCLVHVVGDSEDDDEQEGVELLERAKATVNEGLRVETRLMTVNAVYGMHGIAEAIAKATSEWGAGLLVMGTANRRGLERFVVGSVTEYIITKVEASILLVRPRFLFL